MIRWSVERQPKMGLDKCIRGSQATIAYARKTCEQIFDPKITKVIAHKCPHTEGLKMYNCPRCYTTVYYTLIH